MIVADPTPGTALLQLHETSPSSALRSADASRGLVVSLQDLQLNQLSKVKSVTAFFKWLLSRHSPLILLALLLFEAVFPPIAMVALPQYFQLAADLSYLHPLGQDKFLFPQHIDNVFFWKMIQNTANL